MSVETVKVYKGKENVVCNKTDIKVWNDAGYFTSSQQKKAAEDKKNKLTPAQQKKAAEEGINSLIEKGLAARKEAGGKDLTEEEMVFFKAAATEEYNKSMME